MKDLSTVATIRKAQDSVQATITTLEAQAAELEQLRGKRQAELDTLTPAQLDRQVTLRAELMTIGQMLKDNAEATESARSELRDLQSQEVSAAKLERITRISLEMEAESRGIGAEMQAILDLLEREMVKILDPDRYARLAGLRNEWHALAREYNGAQLGIYGPMGADAEKMQAILDQVQEMGGNVERLKHASNYVNDLRPVLGMAGREAVATALWQSWQDADKPKDPYAGFVPSMPQPQEMVRRLEADAIPTMPNFAQPYEAKDRMRVDVRVNEPLSSK